MIKKVVELEPGVYLSSGLGDPPRTLVLENARLFDTTDEANRSLTAARRYRPFRGAVIVPVSVVVETTENT